MVIAQKQNQTRSNSIPKPINTAINKITLNSIDGNYMHINYTFHGSRKSLLTSLLCVMLVSSLFTCLFVNDSSAASLENVVHVKNETELKNAINNTPNGKPTTITIDNDITLTTTTNDANSNGAAVNIIIQNKDITLTSNKANGYYKLIGAANGHVLFIGNGGVLRIDGITIIHTSNTKGRGITNFLGPLYLYSGIICNNSYGGVDNGGVFEMSGGEISDNKAKYDGGGVHNANLSIFTMSGGKISGNTAANGGGVYNIHTFNRRGGVISGNKAVNGDNDVFSDSSGNGGANNNNNNEPTIGSFSLRDIVIVCVIIVMTLIIAIVALFVYFQKRIKSVEKNLNHTVDG
jgi:hypothetical protein